MYFSQTIVPRMKKSSIGILIIVLLFFSTTLYAQNYNKLSYVGKIIDSATQKPLHLATVLYSNGKSTFTNNKGEFVFFSDVKIDTIRVIYLGYKMRTALIENGVKEIYKLVPLHNTLTEVTITGKKNDPFDIIRRVKERFPLNYSLGDHRQRCYLNFLKYNLDTVILNAEYIVDKYSINAENYPWLDLKERNIIKQDSSFLNLIGLVFMDIYQIKHMDFMSYYRMFKDDSYKKYSYKLLRSMSDEKWGRVFVIQFVPDRTKFRFAFDWFAHNTIGELVIRMEDYAVVSVSYTIDRDVKKIKKYAQKYNRKIPSSIKWKTMPDMETIKLTSHYERDEKLKKYYLHNSDYTFIMKGHLISTNQQLKLVENLTLQTLYPPILIRTDSIDFKHFKSYNVPYNTTFWNSFNRPKQNEYNLNEILQ